MLYCHCLNTPAKNQLSHATIIFILSLPFHTQVLFNLANLYYKNEMFIEALNTYTLMTKNKMFANVNRLKINMGNIYFQLGLFSKAIKMYRMALDQGKTGICS